MQGGPHNHTITGLACALRQAASPEFKAYQEQVLKNSKALADRLTEKGHRLVSGGAFMLYMAAVRYVGAACIVLSCLCSQQHDAQSYSGVN